MGKDGGTWYLRVGMTGTFKLLLSIAVVPGIILCIYTYMCVNLLALIYANTEYQQFITPHLSHI